MANRPPIACSHPLCGGYATNKGRCDKHQRKIHKRFQSEEYKKRSKFYNTAAWKKVRIAVLMNEPLCRICMRHSVLTEAVIVDHIIPRVDGGLDFDTDNLQPLCWSCHSRKTKEDNK